MNNMHFKRNLPSFPLSLSLSYYFFSKGPEAVNQAVKAVAVARSYLENDLVDIKCSPRFTHLTLPESRSAVVLVLSVCDRNLRSHIPLKVY